MKPRVLFRAAAGPRIGFGHLMRSRTVATALGVPALVSIRGGRGSSGAASLIGCRPLARGLDALGRTASLSLLVVDDPRPDAVVPWILAARRRGIATASIHDLGLAPCPSDVSIDGSIAPGPMDLAGVRYAILDPRLRRVRAARRLARPAGRSVVLVAFGGGSRVRLARAVSRAIVRHRPDVRVRIAGGFRRGAWPRRCGSIEWLRATPGLGRRFLGATVAVLAGGVTLYEACAVGLPAIGVAIVPGQRRSVAGLARHGAVIDGGSVSSAAGTAARVARLVDRLLDAPDRQRALAVAARRLVDGRGADRVAAALRRLSTAGAPGPARRLS